MPTLSIQKPWDSPTPHVQGVTGRYLRFASVPYTYLIGSTNNATGATACDYIELCIFSDAALASFSTIFFANTAVKFYSGSTGYLVLPNLNAGSFEGSAGTGSCQIATNWNTSTYHVGSGTASVAAPSGAFPTVPTAGSQSYLITSNDGTTTSASTCTITDNSSTRFWQQDFADSTPGPWNGNHGSYTSGTNRSATMANPGGLQILRWFNDAASVITWGYSATPIIAQAGAVVTSTSGSATALAYLYVRLHLRAMIWDTAPSPDTVGTNTAPTANLLPFSDGDTVRLRHA